MFPLAWKRDDRGGPETLEHAHREHAGCQTVHVAIGGDDHARVVPSPRCELISHGGR